MQTISTYNFNSTLEGNNKIITTEKTNSHASLKMTKTSFVFTGENNIILIDKEAHFINSKIIFHGSNSLVYIKKTTNNNIRINLNIYNNSTFFLNSNCSFNGILNASLSEQANIICGEDVMFSFGIYLRTSDVHLIYDINSNQRINNSGDIIIGNHVWVSQNVTILKNKCLASGSIVGATSTITTDVPTNSICGGNPLSILKSNVFWDRQSTHAFSQSDIKNSQYYNTNPDCFIFNNTENTKTVWKNFSNELSSTNSYQRISTIDTFIKQNKPLTFQVKQRKHFWSRFFPK